MTSQVSVAMCTFNGARFVRDQLESIGAQSHPPSELIVCDDGSTDDTTRLVEEFGASAPFPVRLHRNPQRLGVGPNFTQAVGMTTGPLIAFCDQDDQWMADRLARQVQMLDDHPDAAFCFSDAEIIDHHGEPVDDRLWRRVGFTPQSPVLAGGELFELAIKDGVVTGATTMVRRGAVEAVLPVPVPWLHDHWLSLICSARGQGAVADPSPSIRYRVHGGQEAGVPTGGLRTEPSMATSSQLDVGVQKFEVLVRRLEETGDARPEATALAEDKLAHLRVRREIDDRALPGRLRLAVPELVTGRYGRLSNGVGSALADVLGRRSR